MPTFPGDAEKFVVAFSGGADSILAAHLAFQTGKPLHLWYLHHYKTPVEKERAEVFRATQTRYPTAIFTEDKADVSVIAKRLGYSWEHTASLVRRKRLLRLTAGGATIVTGHNYSDYEETLALRRERKIPDEALPALSDCDPETNFIRPLYRQTREEVRTEVKKLGLPCFDDPANKDLNFARNRIRIAPPPAHSPVTRGVLATTLVKRGRREFSLLATQWNSLAKTEKARTLFSAFRRLAIVRRFSPNHFARAHKLPFALPPFFAHTENNPRGEEVIFRRGLGANAALPKAEAASYMRGDAITRAFSISQAYGKKSIAKIFSEKKFSSRQRRRTLIYFDNANVTTRVVFSDGDELRAVQP